MQLRNEGTGVSAALARWLSIAILTVGLAACGQTDGSEPSAALKPLTPEAMQLLQVKGMTAQSPMFVRIFKEESELEVWKARDDGHFYHFKTYPICNWSGDLGPKIETGDKQAPEGFYAVRAGQMNPNSSFYLSFNLGFPNDLDKAHGRTGSALMVHGDCKSAGCYAMTDALIEEIYALARESFTGGQEAFQVQAFPFRMTPENMERHKGHKWYGFWRQLKDGYDDFEIARKPPAIAVCSKRYLVNASFGSYNGRLDPKGPCPPFAKVKQELWVEAEQPGAEVLAMRQRAPGKKTRNLQQEQMFAQQGQLTGEAAAAAFGFSAASDN